MWQSRSLLLLSLASRMFGVQAVPPVLPSIPSSAIVSLGPGGSTCLAVPTVTVQPFYYSSYFAGPATIYNFNGNGDDITINNGDTTFITQGYITVTNTVTVPVSSPASQGTGNPIGITTTNSAGQVSTTTAAQSALRLGRGLPSGTVFSLPTDTPIILGWAYATPNTPANQVNAIGFEQREGLAGTSGLECSYATRFYLQNGRLTSVYAGNTIGRNGTDAYALISPWPFHNDITTTFFFVDGILGWNTTDRGPGVFYYCGGPLYAAFPLLPLSNCNLIVIGGIVESACPTDSTKPLPSSGTLSIPTLPTTVLSTTQLSITTTSVSLSTLPTTIKSSTLVSVPSSLLSSTTSVSTALPTSLPNLSTIGLPTSLQSSLPATSSTSLSISLQSPSSTSLLTSVSTSLQTSLPISLPTTISPTLPTTSLSTLSTLLTSLSTLLPSTSLSITVTTTQITTTSITTTTLPVITPTGAVKYCPQYNNTRVTFGAAAYDILCDYKLVGRDLQPFFPPGYSAQNVSDFASCMNICNVWNALNGDGYCVGVTYDINLNACYPYAFFQGDPVYAPGFDGARRVFALTSSTQGIGLPTTLPISIPTSLPISIPPISIPTSLPISIPPISIPTSLPITIPPISIPTSLPISIPPISIPTSLPISIPPISIPTSLPISIPPISIPTSLPISIPTSLPISIPPVSIPTSLPISIPTSLPISIPTLPITIGTSLPVSIPTSLPVTIPTTLPISIPTTLPISIPTSLPISVPTSLPVSIPTSLPVSIPTSLPVSIPSSLPVSIPTSLPVSVPTSLPVSVPTSLPVSVPTSLPVSVPTSLPISLPVTTPSIPIGLPIGDGGNPTTTTSIAVVVPTTTSVPVVLPTTTSVPVVVPTTTSIPVVVPTTTSIPVVVPTTTSVPVVIPTTTSIPVIIPTTTSIPVVIPTTTSVPVVIPTTTSIAVVVTTPAITTPPIVINPPTATTSDIAVTTAGPGPGVCLLPVYTGYTVSGTVPPLLTANDFCPLYDMEVVTDQNLLNYNYQIYCDSEIGGTDLFLPVGFTEATDNFAQCLDACNFWNAQSSCIVCEAVVFIGPGACYPKTDIYIQPPIGQFNYYFQGRIAAQVMDTRYPKPIATKETCGKFGCTTTTTQVPASTSTILSIGITI